jgi:hypothetical protein
MPAASSAMTAQAVVSGRYIDPDCSENPPSGRDLEAIVSRYGVRSFGVILCQNLLYMMSGKQQLLVKLLQK